LSIWLSFAGSAAAADKTVFGPKEYVARFQLPFPSFHDNFQAKAGRGQLEVFNGKPDGSDKAFYARIFLNGKRVLGHWYPNKSSTLQIPVQLADGNHLEVVVPAGLLTLRITQPSSYYEAFPQGGRPDLVLAAFQVEPDRCAPGTTVRPRAWVTNRGKGRSEPATFYFLLDGRELATFEVPALGRGENAMFTTTWKAATPGRHRLTAQVESPPGAIDWNAENNRHTHTIRVSGEKTPTPELEFGKVEINPWPRAGMESSWVTLNVRNPGFVALQNVAVNCYVDDNPLSGIPQAPGGPGPKGASAPKKRGAAQPHNYLSPRSVEIPSISPGETVQVDFYWNNITLEQHVLAAELENLPPEYPEDAKVASWNLVIPSPPPSPSESAPGSIITDYWAPMGPNLITDYDNIPDGCGAKINCLAISPTHPNIIYAGGVNYGGEPASGAGLWKSTDSGQTWQPVGDTYQMSVTAVAVDPVDPDIVYFACGHWRMSVPTANPLGQIPITGPIYKSIDGGQKFDLFASPGDGYCKLVVRRTPSGQALVYAGSTRGLFRYRSSDPRATTSQSSEWTSILSGFINDLVVHPTNNSIVYAVRHVNPNVMDGIYRTKEAEALQTDDPQNWKIIGSNPHQVPGWIAKIDLFRANPQKFYLLLFNKTPIPGSSNFRFEYWLYCSNNEGDNWSDVVTREFDSSMSHRSVQFLRAHPTIADCLYIGDIQLRKLFKWGIPGLSYWSNFVLIPNVHDDQQDLVFYPDGNNYLLATDGGVYRSQPYWFLGYFETMAGLNLGLEVAQFADFDVSQTDPDLMVGGTQDTGNLRYIAAEPYGRWQSVSYAGDGGVCAIAPGKDSTIYANNENGLLSTIMISQDRGDTWNAVKPQGITDVGDVHLAVNPGDDKHILANGPQVQESSDFGSNWHLAGPDPTDHPELRGNIRCVVFDPIDPSRLWMAGTTQSGQLWRKDHGNWFPIIGHPDAGAIVQSIAFAPSNPDIVYVSYINCTPPFRLRRLARTWTEGGQIWSDQWITGNLPVIHEPLHSEVKTRWLIAHPGNADIVYVATDKGVFRGQFRLGLPGFGGWRWQPYNLGLPLVDVNKLIPVPLTGEIRAATYGRGVWKVYPKDPTLP
jgi:hypothetical protein